MALDGFLLVAPGKPSAISLPGSAGKSSTCLRPDSQSPFWASDAVSWSACPRAPGFSMLSSCSETRSPQENTVETWRTQSQWAPAAAACTHPFRSPASLVVWPGSSRPGP